MKTERRNITQPPDWWIAFESEAIEDGLTLSEWVGVCCVANLPKDVAAGLSERQSAGRPKNETT